MIPSVRIKKADGQTGVVKPSADGILAIVAPSERGVFNQPATYTRPELAEGDFGAGALVEAGAYVMDAAERPVVLLRGNPSIASTYGAFQYANAGTAAIASGASKPLDDFDVLVRFVNDGNIGTAGITYQWSLDGGLTMSPATGLGVATTLTIPNSGVSLTLGVGTILAGETVSFSTTGPKLNSTDLTTALEALRTARVPWEALLVFADADATIVSLLDLWLTAREAEGSYRTAVVNTRVRANGESEADYRAAMQAAFGQATSTRVVVGADVGDVVALRRGIRQRRPTALAVAARGMAVEISTDVAYVADGPAIGFQLSDDAGLPKYHDEASYPGLDDLRLTTLRTFSSRDGVYITNANLLSPAGSDFVYWQHARVLNKACALAFELLTTRLSKGVRRDRKTGRILESEAQAIEALVQTALNRELVKPRHVSDAAFLLSRDDDISSNAGAMLTGDVEVASLSYIKRFGVAARFVRTIIARGT